MVAAYKNQFENQNVMNKCCSWRTLVCMVFVGVLLLVSPLALPPLPPPPSVFLFLPIIIMGILLMFAFSPAYSPDVLSNSRMNRIEREFVAISTAFVFLGSVTCHIDQFKTSTSMSDTKPNLPYKEKVYKLTSQTLCMRDQWQCNEFERNDLVGKQNKNEEQSNVVMMDDKFSSGCWSWRALILMLLLAVVLLVSPLALPPLPPPHPVFLLVPIVIMVVLLVLAFSPSYSPEVLYNVP